MESMPLLYLCLFLALTSGVQGNNVDLFWNLYDAVISGGRILHDVAEGVGAVSKAIRAIDMFLESTSELGGWIGWKMKKLAGDGEPKEGAAPDDKTAEEMEPVSIPEPDPILDAATPSFSGCGALGFHIRDESLPITRLTECCSTHDACYGSACRANKRDCDSKLKNCLFAVCDDKTIDKSKYKTCKGAAKLLFSGTMALSFQQYNTAQEKLSCRSQPKPKQKDKRRGR
ncbi:group XIIB secretory phospholipase A2-like protein isoform X1 [Macrobrachium nipponense]|uniref:group XIIB secretory phospholipase A2-like protein isoform X1 n=1 Tax=Macrobrachium nipponense TaxID=159736 RepID=UPI0030C8D156